MQTSLSGIANKAKNRKGHRFGNLYEMLNEENLLDCWRYIRKNAAYGVDRISAQEYGKNLRENVKNLVERLKSKRYRAKLVRRQYIPKGGGKLRPLGIPAVEDKLLQLAVTRILQAIYEQDFLRCSYGYRPKIGAHDAVDKLTVKLQFGRYNYVVEADIKGFFDNVNHDWMIRMLEERIEDGALLRLILKWLKAGVMEKGGKVIHPAKGTPQGGIISPVLANIYLHYALDVWFHKVVRKQCRGESCLIRYADDYITAFQHQEEAENFYKALGQRLGKFGLELAQGKTQIIPFGRHKPKGKGRFDFLGFQFYWGKDRKGRPHLKRRTSPRKLQKSVVNFTEWCRENRHQRLKELFRRLNEKLRGYYNYYGIIGNSKSVNSFFWRAMHILYKWQNRRSQRRSYNWHGFRQLLRHFQVVGPRIKVRLSRC